MKRAWVMNGYILLYYSVETRYTKAIIPYEGEFHRTNTSVEVEYTVIRCKALPWLETCLATNLFLIDMDDGASVLKWTNPDLPVVCDPKRPHHIVEKRPGATCSAPVYLPLLRMLVNR